jgi:hypothetical protein
MKTFNTKYTTTPALKEFIFKHKINQSHNILLQIFTGYYDITFIETLLSDIKAIIPHINIIGSSTSGEILDDNVYKKSTILSFSLFEKTKIAVYSTPLVDNSYELGINIIKQFKVQYKPKVALTFVDGLHVNGEEYMRAFNDYHNELIVAGGLAGDNAEFQNTLIFTHKSTKECGAVIALLYNDNLHVNTNASFGWDNIGKTMTITKSHQNRVYEIDGIKARDIYAKYLGEDIANRLPNTGIEFPLILHKETLNIPRAVVKIDDDGSLFFAGNLNEGDRVTFGYGDINTIIAYVKDIGSNSDILNSEAIFIYSCMARKKLLADNVTEELIPLNSICSLSGFFTYGEFYTGKTQQTNELLNQTMTILSLRESDSPSSPKAIDILKLSRNDLKNEERNITLKAFAHLVRQTSKELEEINFKLQDRVIEEVKKSREKDRTMLQQSKLAQMGEMISMIAHQWRQPLTSISANAGDLLIRNMLEKYDKTYYSNKLKKIDELSQHLSKTIDDFRGFYKEDKEQQLTTLKEIVESALSIISSTIESDNITLKLKCQSSKSVKTYLNEVRQVILNIVKNAEDVLLERAVAEPHINITSYDTKEYSIIEISDNGGGVPSHILDKIFEPYFTTKGKSDGTGLGLYMSKTIIQDHCGGELSICNGDEGAIFTIKLKSHHA